MMLSCFSYHLNTIVTDDAPHVCVQDGNNNVTSGGCGTNAQSPPLSASSAACVCNTGYYGQIGVFEFLKINTRIRRLIAKSAYEDDLWDAARESGMKTLFEDAWDKVREGVTTIEEVMAKIPEQFIEKMERSHISKENDKEILISPQEKDPYSWH